MHWRLQPQEVQMMCAAWHSLAAEGQRLPVPQTDEEFEHFHKSVVSSLSSDNV